MTSARRTRAAQRVALPDMEAKLRVALGYRFQALANLGQFKADVVSDSSPPQSTRITATAADLKGDIRNPRTRAWEGTTLRDFVSTIAGEAGPRPMVGSLIAGAGWAPLARTAESSLNVLPRQGTTLDASSQAGGGALIMQRSGDGVTAAGDRLTGPDPTEWSRSLDTREAYGSVEAERAEVGSSQGHLVTKGSGKPVPHLRHVHASADEASHAAEARLKGAGRAAMSPKAILARFKPGRLAGASATLTRMPRPRLSDDWHLKSAIHRLDGSVLVASFTAKMGAPDAATPVPLPPHPTARKDPSDAEPLFHPRQPPDHLPAGRRQRFPGGRESVPCLDRRDHAIDLGFPNRAGGEFFVAKDKSVHLQAIGRVCTTHAAAS